MGHSYVLLTAIVCVCAIFSVKSRVLNLKTRMQCCTLGTNYSSNGLDCKSFQPPIAGIQKEDETACLNLVEVCCKKQQRIIRCELGKTDAKKGACVPDDTERKDCCEACQLGIESKKAGEQCTDALGLGPPYDGAFTSCCEEFDENFTEAYISSSTSISATTSTAESSKYSRLPDSNVVPSLPGLSEQNVCETGEFCAQLCESTGQSFKCACFDGYTLMEDGVSCKPIKKIIKKPGGVGRCDIHNPCDHDCIDTGTAIKCACREGYELAADKRTCKDIDECALNLHDCIEYEECVNEEGTYDCYISNLGNENTYENQCPTGYKFNSEKLVCDDVDECEFGIICQPPKVCKNTIGSFICEGDDVPKCPPGFHYKASIDTCADTDECVTGENDCNKDSQVCLNTKGNYTCVDKARNICPPGFKKNELTFLCEDINECEEDVQLCGKDEKCVNEHGGHTCVKLTQSPLVTRYSSTTPETKPLVKCPVGFRYNAALNACEDINECVEYPKPCINDNQKCINNPGSFECQCIIGFMKQNGICVDINECQLSVHKCNVAERCDNTVGSYVCARILGCGTGYTFNNANGLCEDDDECYLGTHNCDELGPNFRCRNILGSYRCEAVRTTRLFPQYITQATSSTTQRVVSKAVSPVVLSAPTVSQPVNNVSLFYNTPQHPYYNYQSTTVYSTITSQVPQIYHNVTIIKPSPSPTTTTTTPRTVASTVKLVPTYPSVPTPAPPLPSSHPIPQPFGNYPLPTRYETYTTPARSYPSFPPINTQKYPLISGILKKCLPGYLMNERGDCVDIDECQSNPCPRNQKCLNFNGRFECASPMQCKIGYELNDAGDECVDVNECSRGTHKCNRSQICKNGQGYYTCECPPGHHLSRATQMCEDIDECKFYRPCGNNAECINTRGSYHCQCRNGFRKNNNGCEDINECNETSALCEHKCVNIWGSYRCACNPGFTLNYDNRTCTDIDECERFKDRKLCIGTCKNIPGSYVCECPRGYKLGGDGRICLDIDECEQNLCGQENVCLNTRGGYKCYTINCPRNYVKDPDHKARCKRLQSTCDPRDYKCVLMPEQYTYQYMTLVSNLPLSDGGIQLFQIKGPQWEAARAEFSLRLVEVQCPAGIEKVNENYFQKVNHHFNSMQLFLVRTVQGPQEIKLQVEMRLYQGNTSIGNVVVYIIIVVSEHEF